MDRFDVAVVGGGTAGVAAATSAARLGARTLLVERSRRLGGNAADAWVHTICGLYQPAEAGDALQAHPGFPQRFARMLQQAGAAGDPERAGRVWVLPTDPPRLAEVAARLCERTPGLSVRNGCELSEASFPQPGGATLSLAGGDRAENRVQAGYVVDASGDAAAAALLGADFAEASPDELQLPSYIFRMGGVDCSELRGFGKLRVTHAVAGAVREGRLPPGCDSVLVRPASEPGEVYVTLNVPRPTHAPYAPLDPAQRRELEKCARRDAERIAEFLRRTRAAFEKSRILGFPPRIGVRETRRLLGAVVISGDDVRSGRTRDDEVAVSTWPVELWHDHRRARFEYPQAPSSVPLGALVSRSHPRLAGAGRCLSASHEALGALRVIGTALATGEAAGVAAALAADAGSDLGEIAARDVRLHIHELASGGGKPR